MEFLNRWVEKIYPSREAFTQALKSKKLRIYIGLDPTAPHLHLGHSTNFLLLRKFQELGHKVIILVGDFTARIGDPTGKDSTRKPLVKEQIMAKRLRLPSDFGPHPLLFGVRCGEGSEG